MGTNFYVHLGKRSALPAGRTLFTWSIDPRSGVLVPYRELAVHNEYGDQLALGELLDEVLAYEHDYFRPAGIVNLGNPERPSGREEGEVTHTS